ncbi:MAG: hypothetical protein N2662_10110 [Bacteroidales bacterium]|nr:hypothetical protein [Bacteroidales bacterium]
MTSTLQNIRQISKLTAFLGTLILHLLVGIVIYVAKISAFYSQEIQVKVETPESIRQEQEDAIRKKEELRKQIEQMSARLDAYLAAQQRKNIGVNLSDDRITAGEKDLSETQKEIEQAKKQIQSIQENLEKTKNITLSTTDEGASVPTEKKYKAEGKLAVYKGPTNIYYNLPNRNAVDLYVPVYKCPSLGKVVVIILVDRSGRVTEAKVDKTQSDADPCLIDAAEDAALRSRFNVGGNVSDLQKGTITYLFVSQ